MRTITVTEAARHFSDLVNRVRYRGESAVPGGMTGRELAGSWEAHPWLDLEEADAFGRDVEAARRTLPALRGKWD